MGKALGKFTKPARELVVTETSSREPDRCGRCQYVFAGGTRTQINVKPGIIRCAECLEAELMKAGRHSKSGTDAEGLYRQGLTTWTV